MLVTCCSDFGILFASPVLVLAVEGGDKVDEDDAGVVGDDEFSVAMDEPLVLFRNLTVGVRIE